MQKGGLIIEEGVEIKNGSIQVFGVLDVVGNPGALVHFRNVAVSSNSPDYSVHSGQINIAYAYIERGSISGSISLTDSIVTNLESPIYLDNSISDDVHIERNIFYRPSISVQNYNGSIYIKNNVFAEQFYYAIDTWSNYLGVVSVENNSFLSTDHIALSVGNNNSLGASSYATMSAANNYFGTTDTTIIDAMIYDKNDDLASSSIISTSHTKAPSSGTPRFLVGADYDDVLAGGGDENGLLIGGPGTDTVVFSNASDQYTINNNDTYATVSGTADGAGVDILIGVERLQFSDKSVALDLKSDDWWDDGIGSAGKVAKILGAVFGKEAVANPEYVSIGLQLLDDDMHIDEGYMGYFELILFALEARLGKGFSKADEVKLFYQNVIGRQPTQEELDHWADGPHTYVSYCKECLADMAIDLELNASNINFAGLAKTGLSFTSFRDNNTIAGTADSNILMGGAGNDTIDGLSGIDTVIYSNARDQYMIRFNNSDITVTDVSGHTGVDVLTDVERLRFSDKSIALDIDGNAGKVAKILGAVFGKEAVANAEYARIGLGFLDNGMSYEDLMMLALNTKLGAGFSNADEVKLLYQNLVGKQPSQAELDHWAGVIASGQYTQATLGVMAADLELNAKNINLAGLASTGLAYNSEKFLSY